MLWSLPEVAPAQHVHSVGPNPDLCRTRNANQQAAAHDRPAVRPDLDLCTTRIADQRPPSIQPNCMQSYNVAPTSSGYQLVCCNMSSTVSAAQPGSYPWQLHCCTCCILHECRITAAHNYRRTLYQHCTAFQTLAQRQHTCALE